MMETVADLMLQHAKEDYPNEACGVILAVGKKPEVVRCKNLANDPTQLFIMDPRDLLAAMQRGKVIAYYHSHPNGVAVPSMADKTTCEALGLPWHIVSWPRGEHEIYEPSGYQAPYLGRPFVHGVHDCYSLVRDWYNREWNLGLSDFDRDERWWSKGQNLYIENFEAQGFVSLPEGSDMQVGDGFLMQLGSDVPNHAAVFLGDTRIMHHVQSQLSTVTIYGGFWQKNTTHHLRHQSRC